MVYGSASHPYVGALGWPHAYHSIPYLLRMPDAVQLPAEAASMSHDGIFIGCLVFELLVKGVFVESLFVA